MKKLFFQFPFLSRIMLAMVLGFVAVVLGAFFYQYIPKTYFPFAGEVLLIIATWLLLRTDGEGLSALGLNFSLKNIVYLFGGLLIGVVAFFLFMFLRTLYTGENWHFVSAVDVTALGKSLYFILPTVMVQELMFRGYLFTKTISRYGLVRANVIFCLAFMLVHVLDRDVMQNPAQLLFLAIAIPVGHLWFAAGLLRSKTLLFPIGLHWGNNWAVQHLAANADNPKALFYLTGQQVYTWSHMIVMLLIFSGFFLLVTLAIWKWRWPLVFRKTV